MSRDVCGICWCPYDEGGKCGCKPTHGPEDDEALLRQALEALEWSNEYLETLGEKLFPESKKPQPGSTTWHVHKAIAALVRAQALEEAAKVCDDLWQDDGTAYDCREAILALIKDIEPVIDTLKERLK